MKSIKRNNFLKSWGLLLVAIVISGLAFWLAINYLTAKEGSLRDQILSEKKQKVRIIVASKNLIPGDFVNLDNMALAFVDNENLSSFALGPESFAKIEGTIIEYPMSAGEPLLSHSISGQGIERFSDLLNVNERAITLDIDGLNSASGMLVAGDSVDLMFMMESKEDGPNENKNNLRPLLQNVRILAVDEYSLRSAEQDFVIAPTRDNLSYSSVTVGVKYEDASKLVLARELGGIVFMLRNKEDNNLHDAEQVSELNFSNTIETQNGYQFFSANSNKPEFKNIVRSVNNVNNSKKLSRPIYPSNKVLNKEKSVNNGNTQTVENNKGLNNAL